MSLDDRDGVAKAVLLYIKKYSTFYRQVVSSSGTLTLSQTESSGLTGEVVDRSDGYIYVQVFLGSQCIFHAGINDQRTYFVITVDTHQNFWEHEFGAE